MENEQLIDDGFDITVNQAKEIEKNILNAEKIAQEEKIASMVATPEEFEQHFFELFDICGDIWDLPEFKINRESAFELAGAKISAKKLYYLAEKYPLMHFLIEPSCGWFGDSIAVLFFIGAKANIVCKKVSGYTLLGKIKNKFSNIFKKASVSEQKQGLFSKIFNKEVEQ